MMRRGTAAYQKVVHDVPVATGSLARRRVRSLAPSTRSPVVRPTTGEQARSDNGM